LLDIYKLTTILNSYTMKNLILLLALTLTLSCCNKDEDDTQTLPPATQTGAGTFACFVNGKPFIDKTGSFNCFYQFTGGEYYFGIQGEDNSIEPFGINLGTLKKQIQQNQTYSLLEYEDFNFFGGGYFSLPTPGGSGSNTSSQYAGELKITKLDFTSNIVSGTFWFDIPHPVTGERVQIRDGRFDTFFTP
jgi:hypothetical protein